MEHRLAAATGFLALLFLALTPAVQAQDQKQPPAAQDKQQPPAAQAPGASQPKADVSDEKLDAAAAAIQKVVDLKQKYQQQYAAASPADRPRIADEAKGAMEKAVTDTGLSVDEYQSIVTVAQNDQQVKEKLLQRIRPTPEQQEQPEQ